MKKFTPLLNVRRKFYFVFLDLLVLCGSLLFMTDNIFKPESLLFVLLVVTFQYIFGNYDLDNVLHPGQFLARQAFVIISVSAFAIALDQIWLLPFTLLSMIYRLLVVLYFRKERKKLRWLFLVDPDVYRDLKRDLLNLNLEGTIDIRKITNDNKNLSRILKKNWSMIITATAAPVFQSRLEVALKSMPQPGPQLLSITEFYERHLYKVPLNMIDHQWIANSSILPATASPIKNSFNRARDIVISSTLLFLTAPFLAFIYLLIKTDSPGPGIYRQTRTGRNNVPFTIYKFRSMRLNAETNGAQWAAKNDMRVTRVGNILRLSRLDELPQLWNVLKGDMSLIGPRPERPEFNTMLERELPHYDLRHTISPGITGWAQVLYSYGASIDDSKEKLQFEIYYLKHNNFFMDLRILLKTIAVVIGARGR